jgi:hypothetical protein
MNNPDIKKALRHLGVFILDDYACFCNPINPNENNLTICQDGSNGKFYVCSGEMVFGTLKLNDLEKRFISAIYTSNVELLQGAWTPTEENSKDNRYKVSLWIRETQNVKK